MDLLIEFARIDMGIACVIENFVRRELEDGSLIRLPIPTAFPSRREPPLPYHSPASPGHETCLHGTRPPRVLRAGRLPAEFPDRRLCIWDSAKQGISRFLHAFYHTIFRCCQLHIDYSFPGFPLRIYLQSFLPQAACSHGSARSLLPL